MKNVRRLNTPYSLVNNVNRWTQQLLEEIRKEGGRISKVSDDFFNKYKKNDVKRTLERMYNGLCCYCESRVGVVEYGHIEHRKPKRRFPESTYDWKNMHLSCTFCNTHKGSKYNRKNPILDAVEDSISDHLTYDYDEDGIARYPLTGRGEITIDHVDLNREKLVLERLKVLIETVKVIFSISRSPNTPEARFKRRKLKDKCKGIYGSLIEFLMSESGI